MRRALVTGGAGFIGSNLADRLVADGVEVVVYDSFATGRREFLSGLDAEVVEGDLLDLAHLTAAMAGCDQVFHLAANADVRFGLKTPTRDIEQNVLATSNVLEAMRASDVPNIAFSSTGSAYGEPEVFPTPEQAPFPAQTSLYGTSKVAAEGLISSYCHAYEMTGVVFRFVSILGERYTHGHVYDFCAALRRDPRRLRVLGDGRQEKSYLYIGDCVDGILTGVRAQAEPGFAVYNLGTDETLVVDDSVAAICAALGVDPKIDHAGGTRGWAGDSPLIRLDCSRIRAHGWQPRLSIGEALQRTVGWLQDNPYVFET